MKISRDEMARREGIAKEFFSKHPEATVQELNDYFSSRGEKRMGARAYTLRTEARREAKAAAKKAANHATPETGGTMANVTAFPRLNAPSPALVPPAQEADAKLSQDVMGILNDLAKKVAGSRIQSVFLNVSGPAPVVKILELQPQEREVRLGESVQSLAAPVPDRAPAAQPAPQQAPQGGNVTTLATTGNVQPTVPPAQQ